MEAPFDSFFLYNASERERVAAVYQGLMDRGIRPYFDVKDLPPGASWREYEDQVLSGEPIVILFLGPAGWGPSHRQLAIELDVRKFQIIPVLFAGTDREALDDARQIFQRRKYIYLEGSNPEALEQLAASIRSRSVPEEQPSLPPVPTPAEEPEQSQRILTLDVEIRGVSDTTRSDYLGFSDYADALADLIKNQGTEKPLTIGVEAPWGMGKTRLMRMIRERLVVRDAKGVETAIPTVWFDAWKYDKEESLWAALALEVMAQTRKRLSIWQWLKVWMGLNWRRLDRGMVASTALNVGLYAAMLALILLGAYLFSVTLPKDIAWKYLPSVGVVGAVVALLKALHALHKKLAIPFDEKIARYVKQPKYDERVGFIGRFQADFKEIVAAVTGADPKPLVMFIDDLDRCTPAKAVEVLEAINLLLDSERCVFVIGMDSKTVAASIEAKYKEVAALLKTSDDPGGLTLGQRFLEKILQIEFRLPPPSEKHMEAFVDSLLGYVRPAADNPAVNKAQALAVKDRIALEEEKGKSPEDAARSAALADVPEQVVRDAKVERFAESFDRYDVVRNAINSAARYLGNNPRKVKRFVNAFRLQALIANRRKLLEENVIDLDLLARWLVAETRWPELMSDILDDPGLLERAAEVRRLKSGDMPIEERMRRIQAMTDDIRVKRLTEADEAAEFITALRKQAGNRLEDYLHLGRMVGEAKAASAAVA